MPKKGNDMGDLRFTGSTTEPLLTISAAVVRGKKTNRVRVAKPRRKPANQVPTSAASSRPRGRGGELRGKPFTVVCLSVYAEQLRVIDAAADRASMPRSQFMRRAALHFAEFVSSDGATCTIASGSGVCRG